MSRAFLIHYDLKELLLVVSIMEGGISNAQESSKIMPVRILSIALKDSQGGHEISLFEEVGHIWQLVLLLLRNIKTYKNYLFLSDLLGQGLLLTLDGRSGPEHFCF